LSCVGKNHVHVNGEMHAPGSSGVRLRDGDTLSIGGVLLGVAITGVVVVTEEGIPP
jgi:predicted component of type VI protein secretion system